jgi:hypothetical protein
MTFNPDYLYTGFDWDGLPQSIRITLDDIQKNPDKFTRNGLFSPPVFFVNVKVDQIDDRNTSGDIRR